MTENATLVLLPLGGPRYEIDFDAPTGASAYTQLAPHNSWLIDDLVSELTELGWELERDTGEQFKPDSDQRMTRYLFLRRDR